jgi:L-alanine-DL-glutamate epimerase-like enolase superfamily enzyme
MTIAHIQWHTYRLPLRHPFATAHGALTVRTGAIVTVITRAGVTGIGEIAPVPGFSTKSLPDMLASIPTLAVPLRGMRLDAALALLSARSAAGSIPPPIACGLEMALLDALGKVQGHSVSALLAPTGCVPRPAVPVNAVVTAPETATAMAEAQQAVAHGFTCTKLKVGLSKSTATCHPHRLYAIRHPICGAAAACWRPARHAHPPPDDPHSHRRR